MEPVEVSLELEPAEQQAAFWPEWERDLVTLDQPETSKRYTGASLERNLALRALILRALAEGAGLLRIARAFGVSHHTVSALRDSRPELVAIEKKAVSRQLGRISGLMADSIETRLAEGTMKPGSVDLAIILDKKAMVDGDAGLVIEHRHTLSAGPEAFLAKLETMRRAVAADSVSVGNHSVPGTIEHVGGDDAGFDAPSCALPGQLSPKALASVPGGGGGCEAVTERDTPMDSAGVLKSQKASDE